MSDFNDFNEERSNERLINAYPGAVDERALNTDQQLFLINRKTEKVKLRDGYGFETDGPLYVSSTWRFRFDSGSGNLILEKYDGSSWVTSQTFT